MLKVTVVRSEWDRGRGQMQDADIALSGAAGKCCLGFAFLDAGVPEKAILGVPAPHNLDLDNIPDSLRGLVATRGFGQDETLEPSKICSALMTANDSPENDDEYRETQIRALGLLVGLDFIFVDKR